MKPQTATIARSTDWLVFSLESFTALYSFSAAASAADTVLSMFEGPLPLIRMAIPAGAVAFVLLWRNTTEQEGHRQQTAAMVDVALAFVAALLTQLVLSRLAPQLALPRWRTTQGALVSWWFLTGIRVWFPHRWKHSAYEAQPAWTDTEIAWAGRGVSPGGATKDTGCVCRLRINASVRYVFSCYPRFRAGPHSSGVVCGWLNPCRRADKND